MSEIQVLELHIIVLNLSIFAQGGMHVFFFFRIYTHTQRTWAWAGITEQLTQHFKFKQNHTWDYQTDEAGTNPSYIV